MGYDTTTAAATAAARMALLEEFFLEQPINSRPGNSRRATATTPSAPVNLGTVDHIRRSVYDLEQHTRAAAPDAGPLPARPSAAYDWVMQHTEHAPETVQRRRDVLIYKQQLEHAIRLGETGVVRRHRCPGCGTVGLHWRAGSVRCRNRRCRTPDGLGSTWTLSQIATQYIADQEKRRRRAT
ncbi:hypothetical protein [Streptomyces sp. NPDC058297]|uniref:hypothetical protein n=1 Tax=Streptomyces sp. NPDC058297 TaxID=3346433 RepID=UPI0036EF0282